MIHSGCICSIYKRGNGRLPNHTHRTTLSIMTNRLNRLCLVATLAIMATVSIQDSYAQVRPALTTQYAQQISGPVAPMAAPEGMGIEWGPLLGYDLSPDAFVLGAFVMIHNAIGSMEALQFLADIAYGIGTENTGPDVSYSSFRVAATALYLVYLAENGLSISPLAGLEFYRFKWSYDGGAFIPGFTSLSYTDIALIVGAMVRMNDFGLRVHVGLGGAPDISATVSYHFGNKGSSAM